MRAIILILLSILVCACAGKRDISSDLEWKRENGKLKVLSTIAMIDDLVAQIGGEEVDSLPLIRGELDPHTYELVKGDDEKFARADLIFYNGLGLEHGLTLRQHLEKNPKAFAVGDPILQENSSLILIVDGQYDPHIWMDISLWMKTIKPIVKVLSEKDPKNAQRYQQRAEELRIRLEQLDRTSYERIQEIPENLRYLVTSHDAFNYFTRRYLATAEEQKTGNWRARFVAPEGLAPDAQLSVTDILMLIDHIENYRIGVLFPESNISKDSLKKILMASRERGISIHLSDQALYGDAMGKGSYLEMMSHNVNVIAKELTSKGNL